MEPDTDTSTSEPKGGRVTVASLTALVEKLQADHNQLADRVEALRESAAARIDRVEERIADVDAHVTTVAKDLDEAFERLPKPAPTTRPAEVAPRPELRDGGAVRFTGRELTIPRPGATNGAKLVVRHRDVFSGETAAYLREHHPELVESYPRSKTE